LKEEYTIDSETMSPNNVFLYLDDISTD